MWELTFQRNNLTIVSLPEGSVLISYKWFSAWTIIFGTFLGAMSLAIIFALIFSPNETQSSDSPVLVRMGGFLLIWFSLIYFFVVEVVNRTTVLVTADGTAIKSYGPLPDFRKVYRRIHNVRRAYMDLQVVRGSGQRYYPVWVETSQGKRTILCERVYDKQSASKIIDAIERTIK